MKYLGFSPCPAGHCGQIRFGRIILATLMGTTFAAAAIAQTPTQTPAEPQSAAAAPATAATASSVLQPALTQAQTMFSGLKIDKWKKGSVRDEAGENVNALLHDLQTSMPPLITAADAEPGSLSRALPLIKHLDAFYDVMLRVEEAARVSAPSDQISVLQQTLLDVNKARIAYDDQLQSQATTQEKQVFDLRTDLKSQRDTVSVLQAKVAAASATPACKPATPARRKRTTTAKPSTTAKPGAATPGAKPSAGTPATPPQQ
jgi:hypothetical protein